MTMNNDIRKLVEAEIATVLGYAVSKDYVSYILQHENDHGVTIMDDIINDIVETSAFEDEGIYSINDLRFAIGRTIMSRMNISI